MNKDINIAIIGGGIAGSTICLYLSKLGLNTTLFEKNESLVSGPPICHLHAGGNLYREISTKACITLLEESIDLLKLYPNAIDYRPTVLAIPKSDEGKPEDLYERLNTLQNEYEKLIKKDKNNKVLCDSCDYYKIYTKEKIQTLKKKDIVKKPNSFDDWMISVAKNLDFSKLKFPLIMVQEYGLNIFRLSASASLEFENLNNANILLDTKVTNIKKSNNNEGYCVSYIKNNNIYKKDFDYLINSAGFRTGIIDDMLKFKKERLVEFKSAYVTQWTQNNDIWPEIIFFGKRGTPQGMAQFTPYPNGHFQIHGMTEDITLFKDGLVKSTNSSSQPKLDDKYINKIDNSWSKDEIEKRTTLAIKHINQYIPSFKDIKIASKPLYGAQQIPGNEVSLRTADVSFEENRYARCEIVKASSVLKMTDLIVQDLIKLNFLNQDILGKRDFLYKNNLNEKDITKIAQNLCKQRDYPISMASTNNPSNLCF